MTTNKENPFLKIATEADKSNHPTWCFRNTGAQMELSYQDDPNKTGDFWIFDMVAYLANHGITNPDVVTIALSTNDIGEPGITSADALANCRLALEIMITQIKVALPNCKIGIVPIGIDAPTQSSVFKKFVADWIDKCMKYVYGLNDTKVTIIPTWVHMCRNGIFPVGGVSSPVTDSDMKQIGIADGTHWGDLGKHEYTNAMSAWLYSQI